MSKVTQKPIDIEKMMFEGYQGLKKAHDFFDDEMSPLAELCRKRIVAKCREILHEHGDLG